MRTEAHFSSRRAITLTESLVVIAIIIFLVSLLMASFSKARVQARSAACAKNLASIGQLIHAFANEHDDKPAPTLWERDSSWSDGDPTGWDVEVGLWARSPGGAGSIWRCAEQRSAYVGNARALGTDQRASRRGGNRLEVKRSRWSCPERLVLAYDVQYNLLDRVHQNALETDVADISDEYYPWPEEEPFEVGYWMPQWGPHAEAFGTLLGDGHVEISRFRQWDRAYLWYGRSWWPVGMRAAPIPADPPTPLGKSRAASIGLRKAESNY